MVQHCCAYGCKNQWQSHGKIRFHRFPLKQPEILKLWLQAIRRENFYPTSTTVICSDHFTPDSYLESSLNKRLLKKGAVPSIFCFDSHVKKHVPRRQITKHILQEVSTSNQILSNMEVDEASFKNVSTQTSPRKIKKSNNEVLASRKIKILQQRLKRREKSIKNMKDLMKYLREQKATDLQDTLNNYFEGFSLELFQHASKNLKVVPTQRRYSDEMKRFALTLYFYSPKAYNYVRSNIALPHISMLRKWLSSRNCDVGILSEVMEFLKTKATEQEYLRNVALVFDSMSIRSQLTYDRSLDKHIGYVDLGGISNTDSEELATEALIFQIVSYKHKFKCPVAYFFINKISGQLQSQLLLQIIESLYNIGVTVRSITCDGSHANVKTIRELGCTLLSENLMPSFKHPLNHSNIYFILDACHMLKLCRNAFAETSLSSPRGLISFKYIEELHKLQELEDLKLANSLSGPHIYYMQKKMNVRLAAQTISSSVADAIDYLRKSGNLTFADSEATTEFIRYFDRIFDIMNSRTLFGKGYKAPLSLNNQEYWLNIFVETENYIKQLKIGETNILQHSRKTFALGFLINIYSFKHLTFDLLKNISSPLQYFLTYKCSQDYLELFFSCIRSRGGWNNNPNCQQFRWALRKLLFHNSVQPSINANCVDSNSEAITIFEFRSPKRSVEEKTNKDEINDSVTSLMRMVDNINLSFIQENILYYIGGFIIKKLLRKNLCSFCKRIVLSKYTNEHNYTLDIQKCTSFTNFVSHGKLLNPSLGIYEIIKCTEKSFRTLINLGAIGKSNFKQNIVMAVVQYFAPKITTLFHPPHPIVDNGELHELQIIKYVSESYATLRIETHAKKKTLQALGQKATIRLDVRISYAIRIIQHIHFKEISRRKLNSILDKIFEDRKNEWELYKIIVSEAYIQSDRKILPSPNLLNSRGMERALLKIGGFGLNGITNDITYCFYRQKKWKRLTTIPHVEQCNFGTAVLNNELYIVGGCFNQSLQENIHPFGFKYNPRFDKWSTMSPMKIERCRFSLNVVGGMLYAVGGASEVDEFDTSTCECYDPILDTWYMIKSLPTYLTQHAGTGYEYNLDLKLFISGGMDRDSIQSSLYCYTINEDKWHQCATMLKPRADHVMLTIGDFLYVCGGWTEGPDGRSRHLVDTIDMHDIKNDRWSIVTKIPTPRYHAGIVCVDKKIFFIGGFYSDDMFDKSTANIEFYDIEADVWTTEDKYPQDIWEHTCASLFLPKWRDAMQDMQVVFDVEGSV